jgi:DNA-binding response OmpR family regulator
MPENMPGPACPRILVVDDDIQMRKLLTEVLDGRKYRVDTLPSGLQLTDVLEGDSPDLIILDIMLPWKNGFELCRSVKSSPRWRNIPILFLTGRTADSDFAKGIRMGADGYLTKPFKLAELTEKVSALLHR